MRRTLLLQSDRINAGSSASPYSMMKEICFFCYLQLLELTSLILSITFTFPYYEHSVTGKHIQKYVLLVIVSIWNLNPKILLWQQQNCENIKFC